MKTVSKAPAIQNVPVRTEIGKSLQGALRPRAGHVFIHADFSGLEIRLMAQIMNEKPNVR